jgi:hypothetical protein
LQHQLMLQGVARSLWAWLLGVPAPHFHMERLQYLTAPLRLRFVLRAYLGREESALPGGLNQQEKFNMGLVKKDDG